MKDEIKEILQDVIDDIYQCGEYIGQAKKLEIALDYITNLQEEYEDLKIDNKRLQHNEKVFKSRNEKAIEYIKENSLYYADDNYGDLCGDTNTLLNILQGEDNTPQENLYKYTPEKGFRLVGDEDVKD